MMTSFQTIDSDLPNFHKGLADFYKQCEVDLKREEEAEQQRAADEQSEQEREQQEAVKRMMPVLPDVLRPFARYAESYDDTGLEVVLPDAAPFFVSIRYWNSKTKNAEFAYVLLARLTRDEATGEPLLNWRGSNDYISFDASIAKIISRARRVYSEYESAVIDWQVYGPYPGSGEHPASPAVTPSLAQQLEDIIRGIVRSELNDHVVAYHESES